MFNDQRSPTERPNPPLCAGSKKYRQMTALEYLERHEHGAYTLLFDPIEQAYDDSKLAAPIAYEMGEAGMWDDNQGLPRYSELVWSRVYK